MWLFIHNFLYYGVTFDELRKIFRLLLFLSFSSLFLLLFFLPFSLFPFFSSHQIFIIMHQFGPKRHYVQELTIKELKGQVQDLTLCLVDRDLEDHKTDNRNSTSRFEKLYHARNRRRKSCVEDDYHKWCRTTLN